MKPRGLEANNARRGLAITGLLLIANGLFFVVSASALAHHPEISATVDCNGRVSFTSTAWTGEPDNPGTPQDENEQSRANPAIAISYSADGGPSVTLPQSGSFLYDKANGYSFSGSFTLAAPLPSSVVVTATAAAPWANGTPPGDSRQTGVLTLPSCPAAPAPSATIADAECATDSVAVTLRNDGTAPAVFVVTRDGTTVESVTVAPSSSTVRTYPLTEGQAATIQITSSGMTAVTKTVSLDCEDPSASVVADCVEQGATVSLANDGGRPVTFAVTQDGEPVDTVTLEPGEEETRVYPMAEGETSTFVVTAPRMETLTASVTLDCFDSRASATARCADDGALVTISNLGERPTTFTVTKDGDVIDTVRVGPGDVVVTVYAMQEDETATFRATSSDGYRSPPFTLTLDCNDVAAGLATPTPLPDTGVAGAGATPAPLAPGVLPVTARAANGSFLFGFALVSIGGGLLTLSKSGGARRRSFSLS